MPRACESWVNMNVKAWNKLKYTDIKTKLKEILRFLTGRIRTTKQMAGVRLKVHCSRLYYFWLKTSKETSVFVTFIYM